MYQRLIPSKIFLRYVYISLIVFSISSCGGREAVKYESPIETTQNITTKNEIVDKDKRESETTEVNTFTGSSERQINNVLLLEKAINASPKIYYVLGPEDLIEIDIFEVSELKRTVRISSSGFLKLPLIGQIKASGLTVSELEEEISKRLERYLQEPIVSVFIKEYRSQRITVLGSVNTPQVHIVTGQKFLLDMLTMSEGLTEDAGSICYVQRDSETVLVDINELLFQGNAKLNIPVFAGDVIHVPKGGVVFVNGAVNGPGSFVLRGTVTLTQAIAMAKGLQYEAKRGQLRVYRNTGKEEMDIIDADYDAILAENVPDIILQDKDVVIVPQNGVKNFFSGFVSTLRGLIRFGSVSVGAGI
jgi:polysaccharide export outer membrane protein